MQSQAVSKSTSPLHLFRDYSRPETLDSFLLSQERGCSWKVLQSDLFRDPLHPLFLDHRPLRPTVTSAAKACSRRVLRACGGTGGLSVEFCISSQLMDLQFVSCVSLKRAPSPISLIVLRAFWHVSSSRDRPYYPIICPARSRSSADGFREDRCSV